MFPEFAVKLLMVMLAELDMLTGTPPAVLPSL
jgi:hypothetical protein